MKDHLETEVGDLEDLLFIFACTTMSFLAFEHLLPYQDISN